MLTVEANGEIFNVKLDGPERAPVVLLSNSIGTDMGMWEAQLPALRERFRVVRYESRGYHAASNSYQPYTLEQLGRDVIGVLDGLGIGAVDWCGVSMGGVIGQWLAVNAPHRLRRVVLANTSAYLGPVEKWQARIEAVEKGGTASIADASAERWFTPSFRATHPDTVVRTKNMLIGTPARAYTGAAAALRDTDLRKLVNEIRLPVLVIGGRQDTATPYEDSVYLNSQIRGSALLGLDAAHLSNIEAASAFTEAAVEFLTA
jgi:3-oxoadipate enol-lactonase